MHYDFFVSDDLVSEESVKTLTKSVSIGQYADYWEIAGFPNEFEVYSSPVLSSAFVEKKKPTREKKKPTPPPLVMEAVGRKYRTEE